MARNKYDVDEILEDSFDVGQLKRLLGYLKPYRKRFFSVGFMMLSASAFTMLIPQFFQKVMDVCIPQKDMKGILFLQLPDAACGAVFRRQPALQDQAYQPDRAKDHPRHPL